MTREEAINILREIEKYIAYDNYYARHSSDEVREALTVLEEDVETFEALNAINLDLASENEDLEERIGKLIGYIDFLRNTAQGKKKSLNLLEKVVKGELEEIRAEGENFVKPRTVEWIPVTERLPKEGTFVLASYTSDEGEDVIMTYYNKYGFTRGLMNAWMPLPEPYNAESEV